MIERPLRTRLERRRQRIMQRFAMIEAAGELREPGGEIAFAALHEEMEFLVDVQRMLLVASIAEDFHRSGG